MLNYRYGNISVKLHDAYANFTHNKEDPHWMPVEIIGTKHDMSSFILNVNSFLSMFAIKDIKSNVEFYLFCFFLLNNLVFQFNTKSNQIN